MAAIPVGRLLRRPARPTVLRRFGWIVAAIGTAWMLSTLVTVVAAAIGAVSVVGGSVASAIGTVVLSMVLSRRFWQLGRVDEVLVIGVLAGWSTMIVLLSL